MLDMILAVSVLIKLHIRLYENQHNVNTLSSPSRIQAGSCLSNRPHTLDAPIASLLLIKEQDLQYDKMAVCCL